MGVSPDTLKNHFDKWLAHIPDQPTTNTILHKAFAFRGISCLVTVEQLSSAQLSLMDRLYECTRQVAELITYLP